MQPANKNYSCGINRNTTFNSELRPETTFVDPKTISRDALGIKRNNVDVYEDITADDDDRVFARNLIEKQMMNASKCSTRRPKLYDELSYKLFKLNPAMLNETLKDTTLNQSNVHETLSCAVNTIIYDNPYMANRFHEWFSKFKVIGAPSVQGVAVKSIFPRNQGTDLFVVKTPIDTSERGLYHEAVVGFYGLNPLKQKIPNFMYIYGITDCSPPVIDTNNNNLIESFCNRSDGKNKTPYLISENIVNSKTFKEFITTTAAKPHVVANLLLQVMNALHLANLFCDYTHYDLHDGNVMIYELKDRIAIPFYLDGSRNSVICVQYVAVIIDYGLSHLNVAGIGLGETGLEFAKIEAQKSFPLHDIYKLIMFLAESIQVPRGKLINYTVFEALIAQMFAKDVTRKIQQKLANDGFFVLPSAFRGETMIDAYNRALPVFSKISNIGIYPSAADAVKNGYKIYSNTSDESYCEILDSMLGGQHEYTLSQVYQSVHYVSENFLLSQKQKSAKYVELLKNVDIVAMVDVDMNTVENWLNDTRKALDDLDTVFGKKYSIYGITKNELKTPAIYEGYEKYLRRVVSINGWVRRLANTMNNIAQILSLGIKEHIIKKNNATQFDHINDRYNKSLLKLQEISKIIKEKTDTIKSDDTNIQLYHATTLLHSNHKDYAQKWIMFHGIVVGM